MAKKSEITANKKVEEKTFQGFRLLKKGARRNKPPFKKKAGDIFVASDEFVLNGKYNIIIYPSIQKSRLSKASNFLWLVVSTHLKNISQNGDPPQIGMKIKNI